MKLIQIKMRDGTITSINPDQIIEINTNPEKLTNTIFFNNGKFNEITSYDPQSFYHVCDLLGVKL